MDIKQWSKRKLLTAKARSDKEGSRICHAMIAAGLGHLRPSDAREMLANGIDNGFIVDWCANLDTHATIHAEIDRRMRYHGKLSPTKPVEHNL